MAQALQEQRIAIISGVTGYVGREVARTLAAGGIRVVGLYYTATDEHAQELLHSLPGVGHVFYKCNLHDENEFIALIDRIIQEVGVPVFWIHAAWGKLTRKLLINTEVKDFVDHVKDNTQMSFIFLSRAARVCKDSRGGVIIGITTSGVVDVKDTRGLGGYIPAKYALQGILTTLKEELSDTNVRVYSVAPSFMEGGMNQDIPKAFVEIIKVKNNVHILPEASDVAASIFYLCSQDGVEEKDLTVLVSTKRGNM